MAAHELFRASVWDDVVAAEFDLRLKRARPNRRPEFLRVQATELIASPQASTRTAGRALLERVISEYPYNYEAKFACEQLGKSYVDEGRLPEAEDAFRRTIVMCRQSSIGYAGGSGVPELLLAEVLLRLGGRAADAWELLEEVAPRVQAQNLIRGTVFRHQLASARAAAELGLPSAPEFAQRALAIADESEPSIPLHPDLGRVETTDDEREELEGFAGR